MLYVSTPNINTQNLKSNSTLKYSTHARPTTQQLPWKQHPVVFVWVSAALHRSPQYCMSVFYRKQRTQVVFLMRMINVGTFKYSQKIIYIKKNQPNKQTNKHMISIENLKKVTFYTAYTVSIVTSIIYLIGDV